MTLSIIIVNWRSAEYLRACLDSVYKHVSGISFQVIVVDNASYDGSQEMVRDNFPDVVFIQSENNLGFAKANNLGYRKSSGSILLFLNPDTEVLDDSIQRMVAHLCSDRRAGAVGARLLNSDLSFQDNCVQAFPTIWNQMVDTAFLRRAFPTWRIWGMQGLFDTHPKPVKVDIISGACLMVKRAVFEQVGLFPEHYFMYADDFHLCFAIRQAEHEILCLPSCRVIHHGGRSSALKRDSHFSDLVQRESIFRFFSQTRGPQYAAGYTLTTATMAIFRLFLLLCAWPIAVFTGERLSVRRSTTKWWRILRWTLGQEDLTRTVREQRA